MLKGRKAVVTGSSRGIGKAIALELGKNGADLAIIYSGDEKGAMLTKKEAEAFGVKANIYKCNVADYSMVEKVSKDIVEDLGSIDILVNNAGIVRDTLIMRMSKEAFDDVIDVNLKGAFYFIKCLSRYLLKSPYGRIINISSVSGMMGNPGQANYSASKAGLIGLTKTAAKEFGSRKVTVNAIAPGFIDTDMTANIKEIVEPLLDTAVSLKRIGKPEDIANLALFLASDMASYITGEIIKVDGGLYI